MSTVFTFESLIEDTIEWYQAFSPDGAYLLAKFLDNDPYIEWWRLHNMSGIELSWFKTNRYEKCRNK